MITSHSIFGLHSEKEVYDVLRVGIRQLDDPVDAGVAKRRCNRFYRLLIKPITSRDKKAAPSPREVSPAAKRILLLGDKQMNNMHDIGKGAEKPANGNEQISVSEVHHARCYILPTCARHW